MKREIHLEFQNKIKIKFNDSSILKQSLIHKSFSAITNNEKLEFLGDRVLGLVLSKTLLQNYENKDTPKKIVLKNSDAIHIVPINEILYAKSDNNYTTFLLTNNKNILVSKSLKVFDERLNSHNFFRVHQSYLINLQHITSFNKKNEEVILLEQHTIPVAQSRKKNLLDFIDQEF